jgi:hypothetical protein
LQRNTMHAWHIPVPDFSAYCNETHLPDLD